ncbi:MAG TPA: hypothetical protein DCY13_03010, partial [Verrucomicrobiales bacterium]|nr:hypothetical protein [Verrucomicrobiales bacterium]
MVNPNAPVQRFFPFKPLLCVLAGIFFFLPFRAATQEVVGIYREFYGGVTGSAVANLTNSPIFPNSPTEESILTSLFETPVDYAENYGQRLRAELVAPQTGNYIFYICSDDQSVLYLSSDTNPANKQLIAAEPAWNASRQYTTTTRRTGAAATAFFPGMNPSFPANRSDATVGPINLIAGQRYFVEVLQKEGGGGDNVSLAWTLPGGTFQGPIPASHFRVAGLTLPQPPVITAQPASVSVVEREPAQFSVTATSLAPLNYQWQLGGADISGATQSTYLIPATQLSQNGQQYRCVVYNGLGTNTTATATLSVQMDTVKPTLVRAANEGTGRVLVIFSEPVESASALNTGNYTIGGSIAVSGASFFNGDPRTVALTTGALVIGDSYVVTVSGVRDTANSPNTILAGSQAGFVASAYTPWSIGDSAQSGTVAQQPGGYDLTVASAGIFGTADQFLFNFQQRTGDFDLSARVDSVGNSDPWARGGLMARGSLTTNSLFAAIFGTPSISGVVFSSRSFDGATAVTSG